MKFLLVTTFTLLSSLLVTGQTDIDKANKIGSYIEQSLMNNNPSYINSIINKEKLLDKVIINSRNEQIRPFNQGFTNGFYHSFDLGNTVMAQLGFGGNYEFIRTYEKDQYLALLFRSFSDDGINYHEYYLEKVDGELAITDMYIYLTGELVSERLKRTYVTNLYQILPEEASYYFERDKFKAYKLLEKANNFASKGKHKKAFKVWSKIPIENKNDKMIQLAGIQFASFFNFYLYNQLSMNYGIKFPEDPGYYLFSVNGLFKQNAFKQSLQCIDSLDDKVGCDPMLEYLRAGIYSEMGQKQNASNAYNRLLSNEPEFEPGYLQLFDLYISDDNYNDAVQVLDRMTDVFNYYKEDFSEFLKNYPSFTKSETYTEWLEN